MISRSAIVWQDFIPWDPCIAIRPSKGLKRPWKEGPDKALKGLIKCL